MNKKKRKLNFKKITLFLFLPLLLILSMLYIFINRFNFTKAVFGIINNSSFLNSDNLEYDIIKIDENPNYLGVGQQIVQDKDGYFTTFTTIDENNKSYLEYKQNGDSSWSNNPYWENTMETDGCGITAISIILSGYNRDFTPEKLRSKYYPVLKSDNISFELFNSFGISNSGFCYDSVHLGNEYIEEHLKSNRPILICVWNKPHSNRFTTDSHYMVLLATDDKHNVYVSNPNRIT